MKTRVAFLAVLTAIVFTTSVLSAQGKAPLVIIPDSTLERLEDIGLRAHTNHLIAVRDQGGAQPQATSPSGETPQSLRPVYNVPPTGGSNVIAIVDAFDYPTAENDLGVFSAAFGLPPCTKANGCFQQVYATGVKPRTNCGWAQEAALDIEWAHAMAPSARIILVEAKSNSFSNLFQAVDVASSLVSPNGTGLGEVSMSWGGSEFSTEASFDSHFTQKGVVYFASSGDTGGATIYPSASPNVVAAGGTTIHRDSSGNFLSETGWSGSGGGPSQFESRPSYQAGISTIVGSKRGIPDFSFDSDPASGVSVYDSTSCQGLSGWLVFGGTSVASPSLAGVVNLAGHFFASSGLELSTMYSDTISPNSWNPTDFRDILTGTAGGNTARAGWDFVTGIGSNQGTAGK
jgi:subtilase family serine protease